MMKYACFKLRSHELLDLVWTTCKLLTHCSYFTWVQGGPCGHTVFQYQNYNVLYCRNFSISVGVRKFDKCGTTRNVAGPKDA